MQLIQSFFSRTVTVKRSFLLLPGHQQEAARMMGLSLVAGVSCVSVLGTNLIWKAKFFNEIVKIDA